MQSPPVGKYGHNAKFAQQHTDSLAVNQHVGRVLTKNNKKSSMSNDSLKQRGSNKRSGSINCLNSLSPTPNKQMSQRQQQLLDEIEKQQRQKERKVKLAKKVLANEYKKKVFRKINEAVQSDDFVSLITNESKARFDEANKIGQSHIKVMTSDPQMNQLSNSQSPQSLLKNNNLANAGNLITVHENTSHNDVVFEQRSKMSQSGSPRISLNLKKQESEGMSEFQNTDDKQNTQNNQGAASDDNEVTLSSISTVINPEQQLNQNTPTSKTNFASNENSKKFKYDKDMIQNMIE